MKRIFGLDVFPSELKSSVLTWGVFDGLHRGHQQVIVEVVNWARHLGASALILTFSQHPGKHLTGEAPPLITSLQYRLLLMERMQLDVVVVADFADLAHLRAEAFVKEVLVGRLKARGIVRGESSRFGCGREGDLALLKRLAGELGFEVKEFPTCVVDGEAVSSTALRQAIISGELNRARGLLGRSLSVLGTVMSGSQRGRGLGYPTANIALGDTLKPQNGVYVCRVRVGDRWYEAVASISTRPTFEPGATEPQLEVHLLDFKGELLAAELEVEFLQRLRDELAFASAHELTCQIQKDVSAARQFFGSAQE